MDIAWKLKTFEQAPLETIDGDRGKNYPKQSDFLSEGYCLFLSTKNVTSRGFVFEDKSFITKEKDSELRKGKLEREDIVLTTRGTVGNVAYYSDNIPFQNIRINSGMLILRANKNLLLPRYLYFFFRSSLFVEQVRALTSGTAQPQLPVRDIKRVEIPLPPLAEQRAIARILGALDDKIELNRQTNQTLEAMASAIFKSWFVDFDPVRAKKEGRQPAYMDAATARLFPHEFEESVLGEIPNGWRVETLGEKVEVTKGRSYKSSELAPSPTALVTLKSFQRGGGYKPNGLKSYQGRYKPEQVIEPGELVVAFTDVTQTADVIGKPAIVRPSSEYETLVASLDVGIIRPKESELEVPFLYHLLLTSDFQNHIYSYTNGSTVLHLSKDGVPNYEFCSPPVQLHNKFNEIVRPIFEKVNSNGQESISLANIRDTLLPKLMSGEVRVKEAEKQIELSL